MTVRAPGAIVFFCGLVLLMRGAIIWDDRSPLLSSGLLGRVLLKFPVSATCSLQR